MGQFCPGFVAHAISVHVGPHIASRDQVGMLWEAVCGRKRLGRQCNTTSTVHTSYEPHAGRDTERLSAEEVTGGQHHGAASDGRGLANALLQGACVVRHTISHGTTILHCSEPALCGGGGGDDCGGIERHVSPRPPRPIGVSYSKHGAAPLVRRPVSCGGGGASAKRRVGEGVSG